MIRTDFEMVYISPQQGVNPKKCFEFFECMKVQGTQGYFEVMAERPITQFKGRRKAESKLQNNTL